MTKNRDYKVWLKGKRMETVSCVYAPNKASALLQLAIQIGVKSYQCDGRLLKKGE